MIWVMLLAVMRWELYKVWHIVLNLIYDFAKQNKKQAKGEKAQAKQSDESDSWRSI